MAFVSFIFPPLNWPDEVRNLGDLQLGHFGLIYGHVQDEVRRIFDAFGTVGPFDQSTAGLTISPGWATQNGALRYATTPGSATYSYYVAKLGNILFVCVATAFIVWLASFRNRDAAERTVAKMRVETYLTALLVPGVTYQLTQVSTDLGFILMSVGLFFIRTRRGQLIYAAAAGLLVLEDRSYAILAATAVIYSVAPAVVPWRAVRDRPKTRRLALALAAIGGVLVGQFLAHAFHAGSGIANALSSIPDFGNVTSQTAYTFTKSFSPWHSPIVGFAGLVYLPSATEYFMRTIPLYLLALPVFVRMLRIAARDTTDCGRTFFYLSGSVFVCFFTLTNATHVFESGRYYFTLAPLLVVSLATFRNFRAGDAMASPLPRFAPNLLIALNVILTTAIAVPTIVG